MKKQSGILTQPKATLAPDIWRPNRTLRPEIRHILLERLYELINPSMVKGVYIIGSITGYKYEATTDIDVNVHIDPYDESMAKMRLTKKINERTIANTEHPVNYFVQPYIPEATWQDSYYGVYNVLEDDWEVYPPRRENVRNPQEQYASELGQARWLARNFERHVKEFHSDLRVMKQLKELAKSGNWIHIWYFEHKRREVNEDLQELIALSKTIDRHRKFRYSWGWGIPRNTVANIVYKYIAKGPYGSFFKTLESLDTNATIQA